MLTYNKVNFFSDSIGLPVKTINIRHSLPLFFLGFVLSSCGGGGGGSTTDTGTGCSSPVVQNFAITSVSPVNNATNVSVNAKITATFNGCVNMATINSSSFIVSNGGFPLSGNYSFDSNTYTLSFTPTNLLNYNDIYVVAVSNTVKGGNNEIFSGTGWGFFTRVAPDVTPPVTTPSVPAGSYNVAQSVALVCDDGVNGTGCATTYYTTDGSTPTQTSNVYTAPLSISSNTDLKYFSVDVDNNSESVNTASYLIDNIPPTVVSTAPASSASNVMMTATISATFDEPILEGTLISNNFSIDNGVTGAIVYDAVSKTVTLTPSERLECNTLHTATLSTGVTDLAGNALASPVAWSFTTHADCLEPVTTADVLGDIYSTVQSVTLSCTDAGGSGCARMVYTTDGSTPAFSPQNGTIVMAGTSGLIPIGFGDSTLRYFAEDNVGNREVIRNQDYSISNSGFTFVSSTSGILRGVGQIPDSFKTIAVPRNTKSFFTDVSNSRSYRGTETGIFYSDNAGVNWHRAQLENGTQANLSTNGLFVKGSKVYAASTKGLYVSIDGGATYQQRFPALVSGSVTTAWVYAVQVSGGNVYISTSSGIGISTDKGKTFTMHSVAKSPGYDHVYDFIVAGNVIYAATNSGLAISTNGGNTFTVKTSVDGLAGDIANSIALDNGIFYIGTSGGLSISSDNCATFSNRTSAADGLYSDAVEDIYVNGSNVYLATGIGVSLSTNAGASFNATRPAAWNSLGTETFAITAFGSRVLVGAYPSYYETSNNGAAWEQKGLPPTDGFMKDIVVATDGTMYFSFGASSAYDSIVISQDKGQTFTVRNTGEFLGSNSGVSQLYMDGNTLYMATRGIAKTSDGGNTFSVMTKTDNGLGEYSVSSVYASGSTIFGVTGSGHLNKSIDGGVSFSLAQSSVGTDGLVVNGSNMYIGDYGAGINVSNDNGATFALRTIADGLPSNNITNLAIDDAGNLYAQMLNDGTAKSSNNGVTFSSLMANGYKVSSCGGSLFIAGSDGNLYISTDAGAAFTQRTATHGVGSSMWFGCYVP